MERQKVYQNTFRDISKFINSNKGSEQVINFHERMKRTYKTIDNIVDKRC